MNVSCTKSVGSDFFNRLSHKRKSAPIVQTEHWSLTTMRETPIKIGVKVVRHGRHVTFQMAEVAIPRALFADILRLIDRPRPAPLLR